MIYKILLLKFVGVEGVYEIRELDDNHNIIGYQYVDENTIFNILRMFLCFRREDLKKPQELNTWFKLLNEGKPLMYYRGKLGFYHGKI